MVASTLLEDRYATGEEALRLVARGGFNAQAAAWLTASEDGWTALYVVSGLVEEKGLAVAYQELDAILRRAASPPLDTSDVKLIPPTHPIAKDLATIMKLKPTRGPVRYQDALIGGVRVSEAYIYPAHVFVGGGGPMAREEVLRELVKLMNRGPGVWQSSRITLRDGSMFHGVPTSLQLDPQHVITVRFVVDGEPAPRTVQVDEIATVA